MFKVLINKTSIFKAYNCPRLTTAVIKYSGKSNIKIEGLVILHLYWIHSVLAGDIVGAKAGPVALSVKKQSVILCILFRIQPRGECLIKRILQRLARKPVPTVDYRSHICGA